MIIYEASSAIRISFHRFLVLFLRNDGAQQRHIRPRDLSVRRGAVFRADPRTY